MQRRHALMGGVAVAAMAAGGGLAWWRMQSATGNDEALRQFWAQQLVQPDGQVLPLSSLRGRPLLVNFWATWCPPCVRELPMLDRFAQSQQALQGQGMQVLGVAVDQAAAVGKWLERQPLSFPVVLAGSGGIALTRSLGNLQGGLPFTLVLDERGTVRARKIGEISEQNLADWVHKT